MLCFILVFKTDKTMYKVDEYNFSKGRTIKYNIYTN